MALDTNVTVCILGDGLEGRIGELGGGGGGLDEGNGCPRARHT